MRLVPVATLIFAAAMLQPAVAHACRVTQWEIRPGETSQSAIMRRDQEGLTPELKTNVILARVISAERENTRQNLAFEVIAAVRGTASSRRLSTATDNFCYPVYEWRPGEIAILYLHPANPTKVALAVPPRQNIDPLIARDLHNLADRLRQSTQ